MDNIELLRTSTNDIYKVCGSNGLYLNLVDEAGHALSLRIDEVIQEFEQLKGFLCEPRGEPGEPGVIDMDAYTNSVELHGIKVGGIPLIFRVWDKQHREMYPGCSIELTDELTKQIGKNDIAISQDTGLKDKNGKHIYIGDIVKICRSYGYGFLPKGSISVVVFDPKELCVRLSNNGQYRLTANKVVEIIGNIWENPELIEEIEI